MNAGWKAVLACGLMTFASVTLGATYTVTNLADAGPGTLREKITQANANPGRDTIRFTAGLSGTVILASTLPTISDELTIDGTGASITLSGNGRVRIMDSRRSLTLMRLSLVRGRTTDDLGGAALRFIDRTSLPTSRFLTVIDSTFADNRADMPPMPAPGPGPGTKVQGGAINVAEQTSVAIRGSTFRGNSAIDGGAVALYRNDPLRPTSSITNSTFVDNTSYYGADWILCGEDPNPVICGGGALWVYGDLILTHNTFHNNRTEGPRRGGSAIIARVSASTVITLRNTIISAPSGSASCYAQPISSGGGVYTPPRFEDAGGNLSADASCGFTAPTSVSGVDAMLGPLRDNGGPTQTLSLLNGSPALNTGVNALAALTDGTPLATDQRGYTRIIGANVDKGSYERGLLFDLTGIFFPIYNWPIFNEAWAGSLLPVRFGLNGYQGMAVFAQGFPTTAAVACGSGPFTPVAELAQSGGGTLTYDTKTQRYQYVLASQAAWKGTCRKLSMKFTDGSSIDTFFRFK